MSFSSSSFPHLSPNCCSVSNSIVCNFLHLITSCIWQRSHMRYTVHRPRQFQRALLLCSFWHAGTEQFRTFGTEPWTSIGRTGSRPLLAIRGSVRQSEWSETAFCLLWQQWAQVSWWVEAQPCRWSLSWLLTVTVWQDKISLPLILTCPPLSVPALSA